MMDSEVTLWVGIDVGKAAHHACATDPAGKVRWSRRLGNDQREVEQLISQALKGGGRVVWAIDLTSAAAALLIAVLLEAGQEVRYVPGRVVNTMTSAFRGEGKTDPKDAKVIARTARMRDDLTAVTLPDELVTELAALTAYRTDLMADWVRGVNRLRSLLSSIFPALEAAFDYTSRAPLVLVSQLCTPEEIRQAGADGVAAALRERGAWPAVVEKTAAKAVEAADRQTVALPGETGVASLVKHLAVKLLDLDREIKDVDKRVAAVFRSHPQAEVIESLPGMGPNLGSEFLVAVKGDLAAFATSGRLASYAGLVPVPKDSGRVSGNLRRPRRYNRRLRRVFYMAALSSLKADGPSRVFYDRKRAERLIHTQALLALARRLVDVLWAMLRDDRRFTIDKPAPAIAAA